MNADNQPIKNEPLRERLDMEFALKAAGLGIWELDPATNTIEWDERCRKLFGITADESHSTYAQARRYVHPEDAAKVDHAVQLALTPGSDGIYDQTYRTIGADDGILRWVRFNGKSYFNQDGKVYRFAGVAQDVTGQVSAAQKYKESEERFRMLIQEAPIPTMLMMGPEHTIEVANEKMIDMLGKGTEILGKPASDAVPELASQDYMGLLNHVYESGETVQANAMPGQLLKDGVVSSHYFDFTYKPMHDGSGGIYGILAMAVDVTNFKESELENRVKTFVLDSCNLIIAISPLGLNPQPDYNNSYTLDKLGWEHNKNRTLIDAVYPEDREKVTQILPKFLAEEGGTEEIRLWNEVTGKPFWVEWNVLVIKDPSTNEPVALATVSPDITERKLSQLLLEEREAFLQDAVEIAELGTWNMNLENKSTELSQRYLDMFGLSGEDFSLEKVLSCIVEDDLSRVLDALSAVQQPGSDGRYEVEYAIINAATGKRQFIQAIGKTYYDLNGNVVKVAGIAQDITSQRETQSALEALVEQRTQELAVTNEELAANNRELAELNGLLIRSNDDLQRFAYVASHDLQEPLRKIQQFGSLLKGSVESAAPKTSNYIDRMQSAAKRMSTLIEDLLSFSRLSGLQGTNVEVSLNQILTLVKSDLEFVIQETGSVLTVEALPVITGNASQIEQLFQNLINNAIKFRKSGGDVDTINKIHVSSQIVKFEDLPGRVKPAWTAPAYHRTDVADNGIGFNEDHLDRIFLVFQRLHGRSEYQGTGIGLAICEKVVANHGGAITASSVPGIGTTFHVFLPIV